MKTNMNNKAIGAIMIVYTVLIIFAELWMAYQYNTLAAVKKFNDTCEAMQAVYKKYM